MITTLSERIWKKVTKTDTCWLWTGALSRGYGWVYVGNERYPHGALVHRMVYELIIGPVPNNLQLDHLCRVRNCVNPQHLEPVTQQENLLRGQTIPAQNAVKTHCPQGHEYNQANTYHYRRMRMCRPCNTQAAKRRYYKEA